MPTDTTPYFDWANPIVTSTNYEYAELMKELTSPFTLQSSESLDFVVVNEFDTTGFDGTITTEVLPA